MLRMKGSRARGHRTIPVVAVAFALFLAWQAVDHLFFMEVAMATRHLLSLVVGTTLATVIAGFATAVISRQYRRLKELERLKDTLVHLLVHDLRTPLTGVLGALDTMRSGELGELTEEMGEAVDISMRSGQKLLGMVDDLLDISKIEAGRMELDLRNTGLFCLACSALESAEHLARRNGIRLDLNVQPMDLEIACDADKIERVLVNLLGNAIKFTPAGGSIVIDILETGNEAMISVSDTGRGIPEECHESVFDKFSQAEPSCRWSTGLGLYFCKLVVESHGGRIWVESVPGNGSRFSFVLPMVQSTISQDDATEIRAIRLQV